MELIKVRHGQGYSKWETEDKSVMLERVIKYPPYVLRGRRSADFYDFYLYLRNEDGTDYWVMKNLVESIPEARTLVRDQPLLKDIFDKAEVKD